MKKQYLSLLISLFAAICSLAQPSIQGSIQQGASPNSVNITFLPNHNSSVGEYTNYISVSIAIPTASATGVIPTITGVGNFAPLTFTSAGNYIAGTEKIFSWIAPNGTPFPMSWSNGTAFTGVTISFCGGTGVSKVRLVDFTNLGGGTNGNTLFGVGVNVSPFDLTNYVNHFYSISGANGSTLGTYGNADQYVETNASISMTCILCPAPQNLVVNPLGATTATITWNAVPSSTYQYVISTSSTQPPGAGTPINTNSYAASGLTPSTLYYFYVRTDCGGGLFSSWSSIPFTTQALNCVSPAPAVSSITATTANINWDSVATAISYEYILDNSAGDPIGTVSTTTDTFYYPPSLAPGTLYYIHVRSYCGFGYYSNWVNVPFTTICPAPAIPSVSLITSNSATASWNAVAGAGGYQYQVSTSSTPPPSGTATPGTSVNLTGLSAGTAYYFHLRTECSPGIFSTWVSAPFTTVCPAPTIPSVTDITTNSATVSWLFIPGVSLYQYAVTTSSTAPGTGTVTAYDTAFITGLLPGTLYYVYVRTQCSPGVYSAWSQTTFTTLCPAPTFIVITNVGNTADIRWGRPMPGVNNYEYALTTDSTAPTSWTPISDTNFHTPPLASFTTYYFHVRTVCSAGVYSARIKKSFSTGCFQPVAFVMSNSATGGTAELGWYAVHGAIKYEYAITASAASPGGSQNYTTDTVLHVSNLRAGSKYYLHVRTHCSATSISEWTVLPFYVSGVAVYPNPVSGIVTIRVVGPDAGNDPVVIFDASGRRMRVVKLVANMATLDTRGWAAGIYFVRYGNDKKYVTRMIKL